jgi:hypothetical protein
MTLRRHPAIDSADLAAARRRELDIPRERTRRLGVSALEAAREGRYVASDGRTVDWRAAVEKAVAAKSSLPPDAPLSTTTGRRFSETSVVVANETTLGAARRLHDADLRPACLNFANGVSPGGGVLAGARAQEEVLCRSSALLLTLEGDPMYDRLLGVAHACGFDTLVLGAWGCGAFANDPARTAHDFRVALETEFAGAFGEVVFAVTDWSADRRFLGPFSDVFSLQV